MGGGTRGSFEVGALKAMSELMEPIDIAYDVLQGVSVGSINAAMLAVNNRGDEKRTIAWMEAIWRDCEGKDAWKLWDTWGLLGGFWKASLLDTSPFADRMHRQFDKEQLLRPLLIPAVDMNTGKTIIFDENSMKTGHDIAESIISSASIPGFFPPNSYKGYYLSDGGVYANLQLTEAILKCKEMGHEDKDIIVDIIMCQQFRLDLEEWSPKEAKFFNAWQIYSRKEEFKNHNYYYEDVTRTVRSFPDVQFRHLISARHDMEGSYVPIFDDVSVIMANFERGYADAYFILTYKQNHTHSLHY
jgi:predicted acylesterase/phospholipase RssA